MEDIFCYTKYSSIDEQKLYGYPHNSPICQYIEGKDYMYIGVPKCASSTIRDNISPTKKHSIGSLSNITDDKFTFTFIRNPYSRILSCWNGWVKAKPNSRLFKVPGIYLGQSFEEFVNVIANIPDSQSDQHFASIETCLFLDKFNYDFIGKVEDFDADWEKLTKLINIPEIKMSTAVTGVGNKLEKYYTKDLYNIINERYANDFKLFNYEMK